MWAIFLCPQYSCSLKPNTPPTQEAKMETATLKHSRKPSEVRLHKVGLRYPGLFGAYEADQLMYMLVKLFQQQGSWTPLSWTTIMRCELLHQMAFFNGGEVKSTLLGLEKTGFLALNKTGKYSDQIQSVAPTVKLIDYLVANGY